MLYIIRLWCEFMKFHRSGKTEKVYAKLEAELRQMIYNNELSYTAPLSSEISLSKAYNISRESVRKALRNLVAEGLLKKINGHGTFVVPPEQRRNGKRKQLHILLFAPDCILDNPLGAYDRELLSGFSEHARYNEHKYTVSDFNSYDEETVLKDFDALRFDGIVWDRPPEDYVELIHRLQAHGIPQLTLNTPIPSIPFIEMDFERSMTEILYFLRTLGHRDIMFVDESTGYKQRYEGRKDIYIEQLRQCGHPSPEEMYLQIKENTSHRDKLWLKLKEVSAVILANVGCYRKFKKFCDLNNLKIPEEITVVAHLDNDDLKSAGICAYSHGRHEMGRRAFAAIEKLIRREMVPQRTVVAGDLIARRSYAYKK